MSIQSMTGFARTDGQSDGFTWAWELKSVNAKGLDFRVKLPSMLDDIDRQIRNKITQGFKRGTIFAALTIESVKTGKEFQVDKIVLNEILSHFGSIKKAIPDVSPPSIDGILSLKGVIEVADKQQLTDVEKNNLSKSILVDFTVALEILKKTRKSEGEQIKSVLINQVDEIKNLCVQSENIAALQPEIIKQRLHDKVQELITAIPSLPEERLAQEAALLMIKADIREELDRLVAHVNTAYTLLVEGGPIGRQLDFLCQEFNREANTLCSKSTDVQLTRIGLALKTKIEQFREQVQNIE